MSRDNMTHKSTGKLETKRLILRPLSMDVLDAVHSWGSNPANTRYMGWGPNNEEQTHVRAYWYFEWRNHCKNELLPAHY